MPRVYATRDDLVAYAGTAPAESDRLLARASELVDFLLITARYDTDDEGYPTCPVIRDALRRATCAQVQYWDTTGDETGAAGQYTSTQIGSLVLERDADPPGGPSPVAPAAGRVLATAGLLGQAPIALGVPWC